MADRAKYVDESVYMNCPPPLSFVTEVNERFVKNLLGSLTDGMAFEHAELAHLGRIVIPQGSVPLRDPEFKGYSIAARIKEELPATLLIKPQTKKQKVEKWLGHGMWQDLVIFAPTLFNANL